MAHVELSLSEAFAPSTTASLEQGSDSFAEPDGRNEIDGFARWSSTVSAAAEPCLLIDRHTVITAASRSCCHLLGLDAPADTVGRRLLDSELRLLDFTAARGELTEQDVVKIPPLLALASGRLARGLLRVQCAAGDTDATIDAIATPVLVHDAVAGSLTFFSEV